MTELPTTFGKYYLTEKLATGGMAEIYLAKLIGPGGFEKPLVIKQIHPRLSNERHFVDLFVAEAKMLVTLAHGNIVPVYELGVVDDTYFIAMEYIDGPTLYRLTETMAGRDAVMEPTAAAWITARILDGLDYAHRKGEGVIHRDLSPRNVMMSRDGEVKLVDFGIAVTLGEPGEADGSKSAPTGSFPYMSPEQVRRETLTPASDLFSAGVLFWEMLVGHRLFARNDPDATLEAVLRGDIPRPSSQRSDVPAKLDEVVMRALERDRDARWPDAGEMLAALNRYLYSLDQAPSPRDVAALVARFCPPQTRRLPTHLEAALHEAAAHDAAAADMGGPTTSTDEPAPAPPPGPRTAVIPRDGALPATPHGKRAKRHQTFATHVDLKDMLERATPMVPIDAITEDVVPTPPVTKVSPERVSQRQRAERADEETAADRAGIIAPRLGITLGAPPSRNLLVVAGIGALVLAAASVVVFFRGRTMMASRADAGGDAAITVAVADGAVALPVTIDAAPIAPIALDAGVPIAAVSDAGHRDVHARDGGAGDAAAVATGTAVVSIGAVPWGEIYIDGKKYGTTPKQLTIEAGHHTIEVIYTGETPPQKKSFPVDLEAGETRPITAEFK